MTAPPSGPPLSPRRRRYDDRPRPGPRHSDPERLIQHVGPAVVGFGVGVIWLIFTGGVLPIYTPVLVAAGVWAGTQAALALAGAVSSRYLGLSGDTTPYRSDYSLPRALAAQGRYREAVDAWELAAAESAGDPEPYLALARLVRDRLGAFEDAAVWFRRSRVDARLTPGQDLLVTQELIELYVTKLRQPRRAMPELARLRDRFPNTPAGRAAAQELETLRERLIRQTGADNDS